MVILREVPQAALLAAIVNTLMAPPVWGLLALLAFGALDISFYAMLTFEGALNAFQGVLAWWMLGMLPALAYVGMLAEH